MRGRVLLSEARSGAWNLALDEALLLLAREDLVTLRLYSWTPSTLSLGYFQAVAGAPAGLCAAYPLVRRPTGGGALLHHTEEITFSLSGRTTLRSPRPEDAVRLFLGALRDVLEPLGIVPRLAGGECSPGPRAPRVPAGEPFLCGALERPLDVVVDTPAGPRKVLGTAQRRRGPAWLIHGGVRLHAPAPPAPEEAAASPWPLDGLLPRAPAPRDPTPLVERVRSVFPRALGASLGVALETAALEPGEARLADRLVAERYSSPAWTRRR